MKPILANDPPRDPNREALATAITAHAGAARDLRLAEEALTLARSRLWQSQHVMDDLREEFAAPSGARATAFIASVSAGAPCDTAVLERSSVDARAKMTACESEINVWEQTCAECKDAVRAKNAEVLHSKDLVARAARVVICNAEMVKRLGDGLEALQAEVIEKRAVLRFIWGKDLNGELPGPLSERVERLLWRDLSGLEPTSGFAAWSEAFEALQSNSEAALPTEFAGAA